MSKRERRMSDNDLVTPYPQLRQETLARDRGLREKVMSLEQAAKPSATAITWRSAAATCHARRPP